MCGMVSQQKIDEGDVTMLDDRTKKMLEIAVGLINHQLAEKITKEFMEKMDQSLFEGRTSQQLIDEIKRSYHRFSEFESGDSLEGLLSAASVVYIFAMLDENAERIARAVCQHPDSIEEEEIEE